MKKVLSIFMAILMVVTMFSFSTVAFAEGEAAPEAGETEKPAKELYVGNKTNFGFTQQAKRDPVTNKPLRDENNKPIYEAVVVEKQGTTFSDCWNIGVFNPETPITNPPAVAAIHPYVGTTIIEKVNGLASSGEYSKININVTADATDVNVKFVGLKGTADCPIVITSYEAQKTFENTKDGFALTLADCENITVENAKVSAVNGGVILDGCSAVTFSSVNFEEIAYITYDIGGADDEEATSETPSGDESTSETVTEDVTEAPTTEAPTTEAPAGGSVARKNVYALKVGAKCKDITVENCTFKNCRAGVLVDGTGLDVESAPVGVKVVGGKFTNINDAAVIVKNAKDVTVSNVVVGGSEAEAVGTSIVDEKFDGEAAAFVLDNAENVTVERVYSTDNMAFINAKDSTGRVRYNVSARDDSSFVDSAELLIYNNTFSESTSIELNAVVKNNIFQMDDKTIGEKVKVGDGDNNCYYWTSKGDRGSIRKNPRFANAYTGAEEGVSVRDNYILAAGSPCLGKGEKVEEDMGATDFYGNAATASINIGADAFGTGAPTEIEFASDFVDFFNYIIALISNFFANLFA